LDKISFLHSDTANAESSWQSLVQHYGDSPLDQASVIVAIGGDGFMLQTLHQTLEYGLPIYGLNCGSVGFLMNRFAVEDLPERIQRARLTQLHPLCMRAHAESGKTTSALAINEVSLLRQSQQTAKIRVIINQTTRIEELICDGVLLSTAAGSTAYNLSAFGPILPMDSAALALTAISPFRPRRWRGAILPHTANVRFEILEHEKRPVSATADALEIRSILSVDIIEDRTTTLKLLFDPDHNLDERILGEQFTV